MARVLVVGAGAVGQVYGRHLQLGGAELTFFVRDKYRVATAAGFDMYMLRGRRRAVPGRLDGFEVISRIDEVAARSFDQVYLTVSSTALAGPWLGELIAAIGDATLVALQPGVNDRDQVIAAGASAERTVSGIITLIGYAAPLPGERRFPRPGTAYWFPPLVPNLFSGPRERTDAVVAALRAGKLPARRHTDVQRLVAFPSAILMPYLVALESAGWSLRAFARGPAIQRGADAARQALAIVAAADRRRLSLGARCLSRPRALRFLLWSARRAVPLPLETYLREHFTKVHDQTIAFMNAFVASGRDAGLGVAELEALLASVATSAVDHAIETRRTTVS